MNDERSESLPFPIDNVDLWRGPRASQASGLTLAAARAIIGAVQAVGRDIGVTMSCAEVDSGDQLVAFERMDGADLVGITLARDKAFTALVNRMPTRDLSAIVQPGAEFSGYASVAGGRTIVFAGGMPLEHDGVLIGAVGVSGGDAAQGSARGRRGGRGIRGQVGCRRRTGRSFFGGEQTRLGVSREGADLADMLAHSPRSRSRDGDPVGGLRRSRPVRA